MFLWIIVSLVALINLIFVFGFFKSKEIKDKILFQTTPSLLFWVVLILSSFIAKSIFSPSDVVSFGYDSVILTSVITILCTFVMGVRGGITCLNKRNGYYMTFSILSLMMIIFPIGLALFPFVAMYLIIQKQNDKKKMKQLKKAKKKAQNIVVQKEYKKKIKRK